MGLRTLRRRLIANLVMAAVAAVLLLGSEPLPPRDATNSPITWGVR